MKDWLVPVIAGLLSGGLIQGLVVLARSGADRQAVIAGGAEKAVLSLERSLAQAERDRDRLAVEIDQLRDQFDAYRRDHP